MTTQIRFPEIKYNSIFQQLCLTLKNTNYYDWIKKNICLFRKTNKVKKSKKSQIAKLKMIYYKTSFQMSSNKRKFKLFSKLEKTLKL